MVFHNMITFILKVPVIIHFFMKNTTDQNNTCSLYLIKNHMSANRIFAISHPHMFI